MKGRALRFDVRKWAWKLANLTNLRIAFDLLTHVCCNPDGKFTEHQNVLTHSCLFMHDSVSMCYRSCFLVFLRMSMCAHACVWRRSQHKGWLIQRSRVVAEIT